MPVCPNNNLFPSTPNPFRICTSEHFVCKSFRIRTSKSLAFLLPLTSFKSTPTHFANSAKSFGIRTYLFCTRNSFRICTYIKRWGEGVLWLTRIREASMPRQLPTQRPQRTVLWFTCRAQAPSCPVLPARTLLSFRRFRGRILSGSLQGMIG